MAALAPVIPGMISGRKLAVGAGIFAAVPVVLAMGVAVLAGGGILGGGNGPSAPPVVACGPVVAGANEAPLGTISDDQLANAAILYSVAGQMKLPDQAALDATTAALQESKLHNDTRGDADSLGILQERPSQGWGTPAQIMDPAYSAAQFYDRLPAGWQTLNPAVVAQDVEVSGHADLYAQWEPLATRFVATENGTAACAPTDGWSGGGTGPANGALPAGFVLPAGTPAGVQTAIDFAIAQLGKPYLYGGTGPGSWDCSGLVQAAYAAAGITLPRTSQAQATVGTPIYDQTQALPGDLVFIAGDDGTAAAPGHVGMYLGTFNGVPLVLHAPHTGDVVRVDSLTGWPVVAIRRYITAPTPTSTAGTTS